MAKLRMGVLCACVQLCMALVGCSHPIPQPPPRTVLDVYVQRDDPTYRWELVDQDEDDQGVRYLLDLRSQTWLSSRQVDRPEWQHWLSIYHPKNADSDTALLFIGGGQNGQPAPETTRDQLKRVAVETKSTVVQLRMVPNQPLVFTGSDGKPRVEDDLIAYAWKQYLLSKNPYWLPRLPMVKSAVRAMDATQEFLREEVSFDLKEFVVSGGSKRGWTTWLSAAVDRRVVAIIPIVIDVLNIDRSMQHHYGAYGYWAPALDDYVRHGISDYFGTPAMASLLEIVDPYSYRHRLTLPKFIVNASGDQFFVPDSSKFYWPGLRGSDNYMRYVENADHSLKGSDAFDSLLAFYHSIVKDTPRPRFTWKRLPDGAIEVKTQDVPQEVNVWTAVNPDARDFRLDTLGAAWQKRVLHERERRLYLAREPAPPKGWKAFFIELVYKSDGPTPYKFTTGVSVLPDTLPYRLNDER